MGKKAQEMLAGMRESPDKTCARIKADKYRAILLNQCLADATKAELWKLADVFRNTICWKYFLRALLSISDEEWHGKRHLHPEKARTYFTPEDIGIIISIYDDMENDGEPSPVLFNLDYDRFYKNQATQTVKVVLEQAREGLLPGSGIPTKASEKCLDDLNTILKELLK